MPKGLAVNPRSRGPYTTKACTICRAKKTKCDGAKPVCSSCAAYGKDNKCSWQRDGGARKAKTDAHFEAMRQRVEALEAYVEHLEATLGKCACQDTSFHLRLRPQEQEGVSYGEESETDFYYEYSDDEEEITQELTMPLQRLKLANNSGGGLLLSGLTAPFRYADSSIELPTMSRAPVMESSRSSYVFLVDGVDEASAHPDIDFRRYLPSEVVLSRRDHDQILDLGFKFWAGWVIRVVRSLFLKDMYRALNAPLSQQPPNTPSYSPMLHNAMLAVCGTLSPHPYLQSRTTRQYFATAAKEHLATEYQTPNISLVHALVLLGAFYSDDSAQIMGDLYIGMSSRVSISLGLGFDCTPWVKSGLITRDEMLGRKAAFWSTYLLDVRWALFLGRGFCGPLEDVGAIALPFVDTEADQAPWIYGPANIPSQPNLITLTFYELSTLALIGRKIIDIIDGLDRAQDMLKVDQLIAKLDLELNEWKSKLPPQLDISHSNRAKSTPYRLMLHCDYWSYFIVLHRPFLSRRLQHLDRVVDHVKLCKRAAEQVLALGETWSNLYTMRFAPATMLHALFSAGTIFLLLALQATAGPRIAHSLLQTAQAQYEQCIHYLQEMGSTWRNATRSANVLRSMMQEKVQPIVTRRLAQSTERTSAAPTAVSHNLSLEAASAFSPGMAAFNVHT